MAVAELARLATELVRQATQVQEPEKTIRGFDQVMNQADQRPKVAEEKDNDAVTAIGMVKIPDQKKIKLNNRDGEKFWPETFTGDCVDKKSFAEFLGEVETFLSVMAPGLLARPLLEWAAAFRHLAIVTSDVEAYEVAHGNPFYWNLKEVQRRLDLLCTKCAKVVQESSSRQFVKPMGSTLGGGLTFWFQARSANDSMSLLTMIMNLTVRRTSVT